MTLTRRDALKLGGLSALGLGALGLPLGGGASAAAASQLAPADFPSFYAAPFRKPVARTPVMQDGVATYDFTARLTPAARVLPRLTTGIYGYDGTFPGPLIELDQGVPSRVRIRNHMPTTGPFGSLSRLSTHLHGSASLPEYDGYASDVTPVGHYKDYLYPNFQAARTLWYHDHGVHWTAQQAYGGLAAMYVLHDPTERALLPQGRFDVPLMVNDALFQANGQLLYDDNSRSGLWGDVLLVNGTPWPRMQVQRRTYRFRILNCSISRSYQWRLSGGLPMQVVATDGGLVPKGVAVKSMRHAVAERYEVVVDFSKVPAGTTMVELFNDSNKNNIDFPTTNRVMAFELTDEPVDKTDPTWNQDYDRLALAPSEVMSLPTNCRYPRRTFAVERNDLTGLWTFGGQSWQDVVASGYTRVLGDPQAGGVEVWDIENRSGGWFHPVHIHLVDFRIIGRSGGSGGILPYEEGPKDVVYVGESETVSLLVKFAVSPGTDGGHYMVHCHNLPHEDHDMMAQFRVGVPSLASDPHHPLLKAPSVPDPTYRA